MTLYSSQVTKSINYMLKRLGSTIAYKRLQAPGAWSPTGVTDILWEYPSFSAVVYDTTVKEVEQSGGRLELGDRAFAFLNSVFTDHSDYQYIKFTSGSKEFTAGETITGADDGATAVIVDWYEDSGTWAASISVTEKTAQETDTDRVEPAFTRDQFNGLGNGNDLSPEWDSEGYR